MGSVGPVDLYEVQLVLEPRLHDLGVEPPKRRYGHVFIGPVDAARGLSFQVVFIPGLAERIFPRKIVEDPILPDVQRKDTELPTRRDRAGSRATRFADGYRRGARPGLSFISAYRCSAIKTSSPILLCSGSFARCRRRLAWFRGDSIPSRVNDASAPWLARARYVPMLLLMKQNMTWLCLRIWLSQIRKRLRAQRIIC